MTRLLVFSDLDGTLLDHHTYSFEPAIEALNSLKTFSIPCVINTSKTFDELILLRKALQHTDPFIVENGSAVYLPKNLNLAIDDSLEDAGDYWLKTFGPKRQTLIQLSDDFSEEFAFTRFSDMTCEALMEITGLDKENATLAMQREFTEPMVWSDTDSALNTLRDRLDPFDVQVQKGGRFAHMMGKDCDKANAMLWLTSFYEKQNESHVVTIALGDGENDIGMLGKADIPVVIRSPTHTPPTVPDREDAWLTEEYGPTGWAIAIASVLTKYDIV